MMGEKSWATLSEDQRVTLTQLMQYKRRQAVAMSLFIITLCVFVYCLHEALHFTCLKIHQGFGEMLWNFLGCAFRAIVLLIGTFFCLCLAWTQGQYFMEANADSNMSYTRLIAMHLDPKDIRRVQGEMWRWL